MYGQRYHPVPHQYLENHLPSVHIDHITRGGWFNHSPEQCLWHIALDCGLPKIRARVAFQRDIRDCNVLCFTETWLTGETLSEAVQPTGFSTHRADRKKHLSGKKRGGGVCLMTNVTWCDERNIQELKSFCSPDLEFLTIKCRPHYLPREFSSIIITAAYIPPQADTSMTLNELHLTLCKLETTYPEAAFIVAGDKTRLIWKQDSLNFISISNVWPGPAAFWIIATITSAKHTKPSLALISANLTTTPFCC